MKLNYFQRISISLLICSLFAGLLFEDVLKSHAQSSQIWSDPINLSNSGSSTNPTMVIDASGTIHVIWFDEFDGYKYTKSSDGVNWTAPETIIFPFSPAFLVSQKKYTEYEVPLLLADKSGRIHALWREFETDELYYSMVSVTSDQDLMSNWSGRTKLADSVLDFYAVVSSQGVLHVGYVSSLNTENYPSGVYYLHLDGSNWSEPVNLYPSSYFRSLSPEEANVRLVVDEINEQEIVYMGWDDRFQNQILLSKSLDGGNLWESPQQIRGLEDNSYKHFNIKVGVVGDKVLLLWKNGTPEGQCAQYSQWSTDGGKEFAYPVKMTDESVGCPKTSEFITINDKFSVVFLNLLDDFLLMAWNGSNWSRPYIQNEINTFINPATFDSVILSCREVSIYAGKIFVVGCDIGNSGDIWFSSRSLGTVEDWFPPATVWTEPVALIEADQTIKGLTSVADGENNIHAFWIQTSQLGDHNETGTIQYADWNGESWSMPVPIISGLNGEPVQLKVKSDGQKKLLLTMVNRNTGDILFNWAETNRANLAAEWEPPNYIPSMSQANGSPDILVDGSGKMLVAYAIPINEHRGIYFSESIDNAISWSQPLQILDAASLGWDIVDQPELSLTGDGRLHVLFRRYAFQGELRQSVGLYYSQSTDGGVTWSDPDQVSENPGPWNEIIGYQQPILHRLWQENNQASLISFDQISQDGGITWDDPMIVSTVNSTSSPTTLTMDRAGNLHFLQLDTNENLTTLEHWIWNDAHWESQASNKIYFRDGGVPSSISAAVSSGGILNVSILVDYHAENAEKQNAIFHMRTTVELPAGNEIPNLSIITTTEPTVSVTDDLSEILQSPTQSSPMVGESNSSLALSKNAVGFLLLGGLLLLVVVVWLIFRSSSRSENNR